jgi:DNA-binding NarL/FixJ family response regulator
MTSAKSIKRQPEKVTESVSILIADDADIVRTALKASLSNLCNCSVLCECVDGLAAVAMACRLSPDIILMDIGLPKLDGIAAATQIKQLVPKSRLIMLTSRDDDEEILSAFGAGVDGYCLKDLPDEELGFAINKVLEGQLWIDSRLSQRMVELTTRAKRTSKEVPQSHLDLEVKILRLIQQGVPSEEIAQRTGRNTSQVMDIVGHLADKLLASRMSQQSRQMSKTQALSQSGRLDPECKTEAFSRSGQANKSLPAILSTEETFAGRYQLHGIIGQGGTGVVYKAMHVFMKRLVAIKVLSPESASDLKLIAEFKKESQAVSTLKHHNIITIYDFGVTETGQPFLVMDYVDGPSLESLFEKKEDTDQQRYIEIFLQICDGLVITHSHGFIHCDLKPSNILLERSIAGSELVKIVDFGLAKALPKNPSVQSRLTDSFEVAGSPLYMSPEQCSGSILDARSDIYSLGCIMYEAFTAHPVFDGITPFKVFSQHLSAAPKPFAEVQSKIYIPSEIEAIVFKALAKNPELRHQSVLELKQELLQIQNCISH